MNKKIEITAFNIAQRFIGLKEISGAVYNPQILGMLTLDKKWPEDDEVPWCSAFVNYICWLLMLPRSKSLKARSWLDIGYKVISNPEIGFDIVILKRGEGLQPGPENIDAPGHVGFFAGWQEPGMVLVLGGNQNNQVKIQAYKKENILEIRRV